MIIFWYHCLIRCGYCHDHHEDSDRFVFRRCSDPTCESYQEGKSLIQVAAYSYDNGVAPYTSEGYALGLLKDFKTLLYPNVFYTLVLETNAAGQAIYSILDSNGNFLEQQIVQHLNACENYNEGTIQGLYFGGTCTAPVEVIVNYLS